jgi:hypothetical protein
VTIDEAVTHLERLAIIKLELANAPRTSGYSRSIGEKHRRDATAIAMVLAALPEGAQHPPCSLREPVDEGAGLPPGPQLGRAQ